MKDQSKLSSYDFILPEEYISNQLATPTDHCKLMVYDRKNQTISHKHFYDIKGIINTNSMLYFNDTRVIKARLKLKNHLFVNYRWKLFKNRDREMFYVKSIDHDKHLFIVHPWWKFVVWSKIIIKEEGNGDQILEVIDTIGNTKVIRYDGDIFELLEKHWSMPLPHYIKDIENTDQYQPITADPEKYWSVASPTATLHFTQQLINDIVDKWVEIDKVTLHIWLGTFQAIYTQDIRSHDIHTESIQVSKNIFKKIYEDKLSGKKIIATGTTTCRTLESLWLAYLHLSTSQVDLLLGNDAHRRRKSRWKNIVDYYRKYIKRYKWYEDNQIVSDIIWWIVINSDIVNFTTKIYITPGYKLQIIDQMITNFHLPKSSLFIMISSIIWLDKALKCYNEAKEKDYKFYSLGDAMFIV